MPTYWIVFFVIIPIAFATGLFNQKRLTAVKGSRQKYIATNMVIMCYVIESILDIVMSTVLLNDGETGDIFWAGVWVIFALYDARQAYKIFKSDDDNWFNNQFQRLKKGFKKAKEILQGAFSPNPPPVRSSPAPV